MTIDLACRRGKGWDIFYLFPACLFPYLSLYLSHTHTHTHYLVCRRGQGCISWTRERETEREREGERQQVTTPSRYTRPYTGLCSGYYVITSEGRLNRGRLGVQAGQGLDIFYTTKPPKIWPLQPTVDNTVGIACK